MRARTNDSSLLRRFTARTFGIALTLSALAPSACDPTPVQVTTTADGGAGSLRAAVSAANSAGSAGARIEVPTGTYTLSRCGADDTNANGDLDITTSAPVTIVATGPNVVIKQTCAGERVLHVSGTGALTLTGLTITGGSNTDGNGGGVLVANGDATVTRSTIRANSAGFSGGGIYVSGKLTISESTVAENRVQHILHFGPPVNVDIPGPVSGAGIGAGTVRGNAITVSGNDLTGCSYSGSIPGLAGTSGGAGIAGEDVALVNSTISGNLAPPCFTVVQPAQGVAVFATKLALDQVTIADNTNGHALRATQLTSQRSVVVPDSLRSACETGSAPATGSYNWFTDGTCQLSGTSNQQGSGAFLLGPLADNGGPVQTRLPAAASVLINRVPTSSCPIAMDARGIARPQGSACDIGAVEAQSAVGQGPADLSLSFINSPSKFVPGQTTTWTLQLTNRGPSATPAVVAIPWPPAVGTLTVVPSGGGICTTDNPVICTWSSITAGTSRTVALNGGYAGASIDPVTWTATANAPELRAPFTDDQATVTTPIVVDSKIRFTATSSGPRVIVNLFNDGPWAALGATNAPIEVTFTPAPGVTLTAPGPVAVAGAFASGPEAFSQLAFELGFLGTPPAVVGSVTVNPGPNSLTGPATQTVSYVAAPDAAVRLHRSTASAPPGSPTAFSIEVRNVGGSALDNPVVYITATNPSGTYSFTPGVGTITSTSSVGTYLWTVPGTLAPGQSRFVQATASNVGVGDRISLQVMIEGGNANDFNSSNDLSMLDIGPAPNGFADVGITSVQLLPGANALQRIVRATFKNKGPAIDSYLPLGSAYVSLTGFDTNTVQGVTATSSSANWSCSPLSQFSSANCGTKGPVAVGETVIIDFVVLGNFESPFHPAVSLSRTSPITIDPEPDDYIVAAP